MTAVAACLGVCAWLKSANHTAGAASHASGHHRHQSGRTVPTVLAAGVPAGVRLTTIDGEPRRLVLARLPRPLTGPAAHLVDALRAAVSD